jgi:integrase
LKIHNPDRNGKKTPAEKSNRLVPCRQRAGSLTHCQPFCYIFVDVLCRALTFERLIGKRSSRQITQNAIDKFILDRGKEIRRSTLNKDIRNLKAFVNWCRENKYLNGDIKLKLLEEDEMPVKSLNGTRIHELLTASIPYPALRMKILLALGTGLRRGDIESWKVSDLDFENSSVTTRSAKTKKRTAACSCSNHGSTQEICFKLAS